LYSSPDQRETQRYSISCPPNRANPKRINDRNAKVINLLLISKGQTIGIPGRSYQLLVETDKINPVEKLMIIFQLLIETDIRESVEGNTKANSVFPLIGGGLTESLRETQDHLLYST